MGDENDRRAGGGAVIGDVFEDAGAAGGVESRRRLVQNEDVGPHGLEDADAGGVVGLGGVVGEVGGGDGDGDCGGRGNSQAEQQ